MASTKATHVSALVAQFPITLDIEANLSAIVSTLARAERDDLLILPEGALSGYAESPAFLRGINTTLLAESMRALKAEVARRHVHLIWVCFISVGVWFVVGDLSPQQRAEARTTNISQLI